MAEYDVGGKRVRANKLAEVLVRKTHFTAGEVKRLMELFDEMTTYKLARREYCKFIFEQFDIDDEIILERIFKVTVKSKESKVDIAEFIHTMSVMLRGTTEERIKFCFEVYNLSKNSYISKFDIIQLLKNSILKPPTNVELEDFLKELIELTIKKLTSNENQRIYINDYRSAILKQPQLMQCLGVVFPCPSKVEAFQQCYFSREKSSDKCK
ncbi:hypothetical protein HELRODRAFT_163722 [Helobdella robusta]|uniref:EF-hand domain-containing protein n=1 Tax=Helobdella robusta TaxID=6412 RepID=T1EUE4_HELRO|nr:hypothetical protein HELRODRAFT_163722 [Helobdella robusta]ESN96635.1 hypothetical protein HELRODRAFT_163722 [Helobdella robusta]